jgi:glycosyltransferase involved in cell wall biosynthesis
VCTFNRSSDLSTTLDSVRCLDVEPPLTWEVIVVDNHSTDDTREVVARHQAVFPTTLKYVFEPLQGKSNALNTGLRLACGRLIAFTDDDVSVPSNWLMNSIAPLLRDPDLAYTGGPVRPIWHGRKPSWLDERGRMGGTIAVKDHGPAPFIFEKQQRIPLGVNMTVRRKLIERIGGFHPDLGPGAPRTRSVRIRNRPSLLGQEQADFFYRTRRAGARGMYVPDAIMDHQVSASRLNLRYFRRWWYLKGLAHARVHALHGETELGLDLRTTPHIYGVPRYLIPMFARHLAGCLGTLLRGRSAESAEHFCMMAYVLGYISEARRRDPGRSAQGASITAP